MNVTKHEHACLVVEEQGKKLVIDPGEYTASLTDLTNIVGVVITHVHGDHFSPRLLQAIVQQNPEARILSTAQVAQALPAVSITAVTGGAAETIQGFTVQFFGEWHALVHADKPHDQNIGVLVNNALYFPGDSFTEPQVPVEVLALPVSGPWMKTGEAMDFLAGVKPQRCFGTHDVHLSDIGHDTFNAWLEAAAQAAGATFSYLKPGEHLSL